MKTASVAKRSWPRSWDGEMRAFVVMVSLVLVSGTAFSIEPDECKIQRAQYPRNWKDVTQEKGLFDCRSHYAGALRVKLGANDSAGRALMSLVALTESNS